MSANATEEPVSDQAGRGRGDDDSGTRKRLAAARGRLLRGSLGLVGFGLIIAAWYAVEALELFGPGLLPTPDQVVAALVELWGSGNLILQIRTSVQRVALGVAIGVALAIPVGFVLGWYRIASLIFDPVVNFLRALPPIALIPLVVVYFGIGETARLSVIVYAAFFSGVIVIYEGVRSLDPIYIRAGNALGAAQWEIFARIVLPLSVPSIFVALRVALGVSWATLVAAELIAAQDGLGAMIQQAGNFFQIPVIYGGIILIGIAALVMDRVLRVVTKRLVSWREEVTA